MAHLSDGAFFNFDLHRNPVAGEVLDLRLDAGAVAALGDVLPRELELDALEGGPLENLPFGEPRSRQPLEERIGFDGLVALKGDGVDGRALQERQHQHVAVAPDADIAEVARGEEGAEGLPSQIFIVAIPDVHREQAKYRPRGNPLQPLHPDISDGEGRGATGVFCQGPQGSKAKHQRHEHRARGGEKRKFH